MTIRTRFSLWYGTILFVSLCLVGGLSYREFHKHPEEEPDSDEDTKAVLSFILWGGLPAAVLGLIGGWWLMCKTLGPIASLTRAAEKIHEGNLHVRLPRTGNRDELDRLTEVFNLMTTRLDGSFHRIREFTLHASHELKTPLSVMHGELEMALRDETLESPQRERLLSQLDEVQRLAKIVNGLALLTRADAGQVELAREPVRLDELVRDAHADAQILAQPHQVQVDLQTRDEITIQGDRHRLRQLLLNLTDNAIKYNQPKGIVNIELRRFDQVAELHITNTGKGIPPELHARVFDRFFRGDQSHSNEIEGCGLGLSIAQWIAVAHGGSIHFASNTALTSVTVRMPITASVEHRASDRRQP